MPRAKAVFGAGCFWAVEARFAAMPGVVDTAAGYAGGDVAEPTYEQVCTGRTGHAEVVEVTYDPEKVAYVELLEAFFKMHNPAQPYLAEGAPAASKRDQYRSVVFTCSEAQAQQAQDRLQALRSSAMYPDGVATEVQPAPRFWRAEERHQQYFEKRNIQV